MLFSHKDTLLSDPLTPPPPIDRKYPLAQTRNLLRFDCCATEPFRGLKLNIHTGIAYDGMTLRNPFAIQRWC